MFIGEDRLRYIIPQTVLLIAKLSIPFVVIFAIALIVRFCR